jgi:radical SAM protein with 4Fe4S-binding SPASM domain
VSGPSSAALTSLPLLTLHLTERCNSRCISCDYWRHGERDVSLAVVARLLPELRALGACAVLITGGEPLVHPQWREIAALLRSNGLRLWLHTAGLALLKHADRIPELFEFVTVSLDGANREMYAAIRGVDAFDRVCAGIRAIAASDAHVSLRVTVQRANYRALPQLVDLARSLAVSQISFLAADVTNPHAFGRRPDFAANVALSAADLEEFAVTLDTLERNHAHDFESGFIAERPAKLRRLLDYYRAVCGLGSFPPVRCNAPEFSAVVSSDGRVHPCFFISGPEHANVRDGLTAAMNDSAMSALRDDIRHRRRTECDVCVCSLWRDRATLDADALLTAS